MLEEEDSVNLHIYLWGLVNTWWALSLIDPTLSGLWTGCNVFWWGCMVWILVGIVDHSNLGLYCRLKGMELLNRRSLHRGEPAPQDHWSVREYRHRRGICVLSTILAGFTLKLFSTGVALIIELL